MFRLKATGSRPIWPTMRRWPRIGPASVVDATGQSGLWAAGCGPPRQCRLLLQNLAVSFLRLTPVCYRAPMRRKGDHLPLHTGCWPQPPAAGAVGPNFTSAEPHDAPLRAASLARPDTARRNSASRSVDHRTAATLGGRAVPQANPPYPTFSIIAAGSGIANTTADGPRYVAVPKAPNATRPLS